MTIISLISQLTMEVYRKYLSRVPRIFYLTIIASLLLLRGGLFNPEAVYFLNNFLDDRPFLVKIFDAERGRSFQAREFSYLMDFIDSHAILVSVKIKVLPFLPSYVQFYSLTHYVAIIAMATLAVIISRRFFGQKFREIAILVSLLYLTSPSPFLTGSFYRSSKILVSFFIVLIVYLLFRYASRKAGENKLLVFIILSSLLMSLSDKQGFFYVGAFAAVAGAIFLVERTWKSLKVPLCFGLGLGLYKYYNDALGPWLVTNVGKQALNPTNYIQDAEFYKYIPAVQTYFPQARTYLLYQFSYLLGNQELAIGTVITAVLFLLIIYLIFIKEAAAKGVMAMPLVKKTTLYVLFLPFFSIPMTTFMLHYSMAFLNDLDLRRVYYNLPIAASILLFLQLVVSRVTAAWPKKRELIKGALLVLLALNIIALPQHYMIVRYSENLKVHFDKTEAVRRCILERDKPQKLFTGEMTQHGDGACTLFRKLLGENIRGPDERNERKITLAKPDFPQLDLARIYDSMASMLFKVRLPRFFTR